MKIEVGKTYLDREGTEIKIIGTQDDPHYPILGQSADGEDCNFSTNGYYTVVGDCVYDLVSLAPPPAPATDGYDPPRLWNLLRTTWAEHTVLPTDSGARKAFPLAEGFDHYFPAATVAVAGWSKMANAKHNPGQPLQHARGKSADHEDCQRRHQLDALDTKRDRLEELTCKAWRALAELQEYAETLGAPAAPAATFPKTNK